MIADILRWLQDQIDDYTAARPLTVHQWVQVSRLRRVRRILRAYDNDDNGEMP